MYSGLPQLLLQEVKPDLAMGQGRRRNTHRLHHFRDIFMVCQSTATAAGSNLFRPRTVPVDNGYQFSLGHFRVNPGVVLPQRAHSYYCYRNLSISHLHLMSF